MLDGHLSTYLNDHLTGAVAALEMLPHLATAHRDLVDVDTLHRVEREVREDRGTLESLMKQLGVKRQPARHAVGWLGERLTRLKMIVDDPGNGALRAFETIELVSLGIEGKVALWTSLSAIASSHPALRSMNFADLIRARSGAAAAAGALTHRGCARCAQRCAELLNRRVVPAEHSFPTGDPMWSLGPCYGPNPRSSADAAR